MRTFVKQGPNERKSNVFLGNGERPMSLSKERKLLRKGFLSHLNTFPAKMKFMIPSHLLHHSWPENCQALFCGRVCSPQQQRCSAFSPMTSIFFTWRTCFCSNSKPGTVQTESLMPTLSSLQSSVSYTESCAEPTTEKPGNLSLSESCIGSVPRYRDNNSPL